MIRSLPHNMGNMKKSPKRLTKSGFGDKERDVANKEYLDKRAKNNAAVKRARQKAKERTEQTNTRIQRIKRENQELEARIKKLSDELNEMKDAYSKYTGRLL